MSADVLHWLVVITCLLIFTTPSHNFSLFLSLPHAPSKQRA